MFKATASSSHPASRPRRARTAALMLGAVSLPLLIAACSPQNAQGTLNRVVSTRGLVTKTDQRYGPDARNVLDVYSPEGATNAPIVLFIHGGSWEGGDKEGHKFAGESFARAGYVTGVMNYRLAPANRYPSYVQDAAAALKWLRDNAKAVGGNPNNLFVMGHSAGGFNAVEMVDNERWLREAGVPIASVRGVIGIAGPYSYDFRDFPSARAFPVGGNPEDIMPDRHVRKDAPPHLLLVAENDTVVYPMNAVNMEAALKAAGIPVTRNVIPRVNHVTIMAAVARPLTFLGNTRQQAIDFIEKYRVR